MRCLTKAKTVYMTTLVIAYLGVLSYEVYICMNPEAAAKIDFYGKILGYSFLVAFVLLAVVNFYLIAQLRKMNRLMGSFNSTLFDREKLNLVLTFIVFDFGYLLRFFWDEW